MHVCLLNPPTLLYGGAVGVRPTVNPPLGLAYVAGALERYHQVSIIDAVAENWVNLKVYKSKYYLGLEYSEIAKRIEAIPPSCCGHNSVFNARHRKCF